MTKEKTIWDFWAKHYNRLWVQKNALQPTRKIIKKQIKQIIEQKNSEQKKFRVIDIGCGTGQLLNEIADEFSGCGIELTGVDLSSEMLKIAQASNDKISYKQLNVDEWKTDELPLACYDIVICANSLPYYREQSAALKKMRAILKNDGSLLLAHASINNIYDWFVMSIVGLTVSKHNYLSSKQLQNIAEGVFIISEQAKVSKGLFMPSLYFYKLKKKEDNL